MIYAAEHGVKAIYAEKALSASMDEADAIVSAVEANGAILNMGTNRRWHPGFDKMKEVIDSGELGALRSVIIYNNGTLFNTSSHTFDLAMRLNSDCPVAWAQGHLPGGSGMFEGDILKEDPRAHGMFQFENGVTVYPMLTAAWSEYSVICEGGIMSALNNGIEWQLRKKVSIGPKGRSGLEEGTYPAFEEASSTLKLVEDLVHSLDTGEPPRGGVQIARANTELIFAFIESELQGGARVELPLTGSRVRLQRDGAPKQPMLAPNEL